MRGLAQVVEQWTGNPKAAGSIPVGRQFFALLVLSSRRSGGSSLGFRAGSPSLGQKHAKRLKY